MKLVFYPYLVACLFSHKGHDLKGGRWCREAPTLTNTLRREMNNYNLVNIKLTEAEIYSSIPNCVSHFSFSKHTSCVCSWTYTSCLDT
jgi:hypothetical protein